MPQPRGVTLSIVLLVAGWTFAAAAQQGENPFTGRIDVRMGRNLYQGKCTSCHGIDAKGSEEGDGPDLTTGSFQHAESDGGLFRVIRDGIPDTSMRGLKKAPDQTIWQLVTYIRSLNPVPADLDLPGSIDAGAALFEAGECGSCHKVGGHGGRLGPDLSTVAQRRTPAQLHSDLTAPDAEVRPRWWTLRVTRNDGSVVQGTRMGEDTFTVRMMDADENLRAFTKRDVQSVETIKSSTMPSQASLTPAQLDDLVAYLSSLRTGRSP